MLIYLIRNRVNGKVYIGKTTKSLETRWRWHVFEAHSNSQFYFHRAIRKYGVAAFEKVELCKAKCNDELNKRERHYIKAFSACVPKFGYNQKSGGEGGGLTKAARRKISLAMKGRKLSTEHKQKLSDAKRGKPSWRKGKKTGLPAYNRGVPNSEETRAKISSAVLLRNETRKRRQQVYTPEVRAKISESHKRLYDSDEKRKAAGEHMARIRQFLTPENRGGAQPGDQNHMFGLHHSEETRRKISERAKARVAAGAVNPMQGVPSPMTGKKHSPEALAKIRASKRAYWAAKRAAANS